MTGLALVAAPLTTAGILVLLLGASPSAALVDFIAAALAVLSVPVLRRFA